MSPRFPLIFGAAAFGEGITTRVHTLDEAQTLVDIFVDHGHSTFDTSNFYGSGTSEQFLSKLDLKGASVDTKVHPGVSGGHSPEALRRSVERSIETLSPKKINVLYLHIPDRSVPFVDAAREINELHKRGLFKEFGLSNYMSWEVAEFYNICEAHGWIRPTVYQGCYNLLERHVETELLPCLKKYNIKFYAYSPLAGGILTGKFLSEADMAAAQKSGSRFDANGSGGAVAGMLVQRYSPAIPTVQRLNGVLKRYNIGLAEAAFRWLHHHSALKEGDTIIIGASNVVQLESNLAANEGGPLPEEALKAVEEAWQQAKSIAAPYFF